MLIVLFLKVKTMMYIFLDRSQLFLTLAAHWNHLCVFHKCANSRLLAGIIGLTGRGRGGPAPSSGIFRCFVAVVGDY